MKTIEELTIAELAHAAKYYIPGYDLILDDKPVDVDAEIEGLFDAVEEVSQYYRQRILACLRTIIDINSYKDDTPEVDDRRPMGFRGSWMDE